MPVIAKLGRKDLIGLVESQSYACALTGWPLKPETASLDHQIPVSRGGDHELSNLQVLDYRVNKAKGTMTNEEFIDMCRAVYLSQSQDVRSDVAQHAETSLFSE
jgi:hypothetical protein